MFRKWIVNVSEKWVLYMEEDTQSILRGEGADRGIYIKEYLGYRVSEQRKESTHSGSRTHSPQIDMPLTITTEVPIGLNKHRESGYSNRQQLRCVLSAGLLFSLGRRLAGARPAGFWLLGGGCSAGRHVRPPRGAGSRPGTFGSDRAPRGPGGRGRGRRPGRASGAGAHVGSRPRAPGGRGARLSAGVAASAGGAAPRGH